MKLDDNSALVTVGSSVESSGVSDGGYLWLLERDPTSSQNAARLVRVAVDGTRTPVGTARNEAVALITTPSYVIAALGRFGTTETKYYRWPKPAP